MKTKHPIFKAYRDGELIDRQAFAISPVDGEDSPCIDSKYCDDLRLFTGFEDCHGEPRPVYEMDTVYGLGTKGPGTVVMSSWGQWIVKYDIGGYDNLFSKDLGFSLTPPREERRKNTWPRRSSNRRNRDGLKHFDRRQP